MVWHSEICDFFIGNSVDAQSQYSDADLSGFEQIEKKVLSSKLAAQSAADEAKQYAGKATLSASELSSSVTALNSHIESKSNPHGVTKAQLGLGSVDNTSDKNKPVSDAVKAELDKKANHAAVQTAINVLGETMNAHNDSKNNPHSVTKAQIGLSNVDNTADKDKPVSDAVKTELSKKADAENLNSHTENTSNPHGVTAEQVGAYGCQEVDNKLSARAKLLHSHRTASSGIRQEINLTERTIIAADISESGRISDKQLYGAGTTFIFDVSGTISIKGTMDSQGELKNGRTTVFRHYPSETFSPLEFEETFTVQKGSSLTLYLSAGKCDFDYFYETSQTDGFMTSADKAKLDGLPNDAYSKSETDSKIDLLSLKAEKSGEALRISDACELEQTADVTLTSDAMIDFSAVSVKKYGKNLIPYPYMEMTKTVNGITFTDNGDGSITVNGTATANAIYFVRTNTNFTVEKGIYTLSGCPTGGNKSSYSLGIDVYNDKTWLTNFFDYGEGVFVDLTSSVFTGLPVYIRVVTGTTVNNLVFKPMLELGNAATDYEPYKAPVTYTPDSDGKVSGVTLGPDTATLTTDPSVVIINAKYKKDITKAFEELETKLTNAILSNGGNV